MLPYTVVYLNRKYDYLEQDYFATGEEACIFSIGLNKDDIPNMIIKVATGVDGSLNTQEGV